MNRHEIESYLQMLGEDVRDLRALLRYLSIGSAQEATSIVEQYIPAHLLTPRVQYLIEGLFEDEAPS